MGTAGLWDHKSPYPLFRFATASTSGGQTHSSLACRAALDVRKSAVRRRQDDPERRWDGASAVESR